VRAKNQKFANQIFFKTQRYNQFFKNTTHTQHTQHTNTQSLNFFFFGFRPGSYYR